MALNRIQVAFGADTGLPRDRLVTTFHLDQTNPDPTADWDGEGGIGADIADFFAGWTNGGREVAVRSYLVDESPASAPSGPPEWTVIRNVDVFPQSATPREIALCLSYRGETNTARTRGRMYIPVVVFPAATGNVTQRPAPLYRTRALDVADAIAGFGGIDVDWVVWSPTYRVKSSVRTAWVDDEWDTIRSRGLQPSTRDTRSYSE
jgi:hypothetical protein